LYGLVGEGMTLVVSTPYMDEADRCQRLALIERGRLVICATPKDLRESMKQTVAELRSSNPQAARNLLSEMPGVLGVQAFGGRIHVTIRGAELVNEIRSALETAGLDVFDLRVIAPSLEDAVIASLEGAASRA